MSGKSKFAKEVGNAMSRYRVNRADLAWIMGASEMYSIWGPSWNHYRGWFEKCSDPLFDEPTTPEKCAEILDLIKNASSNPKYWERKYRQSKVILGIYGAGLNRLSAQKEDWRKKYWDVYYSSFAGRWWRIKFWVWRNTSVRYNAWKWRRKQRSLEDVQ